MSPNKRIQLLDGLRSLAVLFMVGWHFCWDLTRQGLMGPEWMSSGFSVFLQDSVPCVFILLAGISSRFSRNNFKRAGKTLLCALLVTGTTLLVGDPAWFGVLHLLGVSMLLYALLEKRFRRWPEVRTAGICLLLFGLCWLGLHRVRVGFDALFWLGLRSSGFASSDYYPLLPWMFLFFAGAAMGETVIKSEGSWKNITLPQWVTWPGRHALWIYMLHQPVLMGLAYLLRLL